MSWVRFGSVCGNAFPPNELNDVCPDDKCPGSDLYIFERGENEVECCGCAFGEYFFGNEEQMLDHIDRHVAAGHHVRRSLLRDPSKFNPGSSLRTMSAKEFSSELWARARELNVKDISSLFKIAEELQQKDRKHR